MHSITHFNLWLLSMLIAWSIICSESISMLSVAESIYPAEAKN